MAEQAPVLITWQSRLQRVLSGILFGVAFVLGVVALMPFLPAAATTAGRTLYFKLPLEGVRFHWMFLDSAAFLSGELTLRILNKDHDQTLVVFRDGIIHDNWKMIGDARPDGAFYYGFSTTDLIRTRADDSLIVTLKATKDLVGQGPYSEGVLPAGVWQMAGSYSSIYGGRWRLLDRSVLRGRPPVAYMECWTGVWPITITKHEGWKGAPPPDEVSASTGRTISRGTNGRPCGSHI